MLLCASCLQPRKWPIPELSLPGTPARIPPSLVAEFPPEFISPDGTQTLEKPGAYSWAKGFNYGLGWDALVRHVGGKIEPLGYKPYTGGDMSGLPSIPGVRDGTIARGWLSNDKKYLLILVNIAFLKDQAAAGFAATDANYVIIIDDQDYYKLQGETSPNQ